MAQPRIQVLKPRPNFAGITPSLVSKLIPNLAMWGVAGAGALVVVGSSIPLFKTDVLIKIPFIGEYYVDRTPDSDKPFCLCFVSRRNAFHSVP
ncbi:hypothetical protein JCM8547_000135 [Rhodosporidiobolus lusitaniae]